MQEPRPLSASYTHARSNSICYFLLSPMTLLTPLCLEYQKYLSPPPHAPLTPSQKEKVYTHLKICIIDIFKYQSWCLWLQERIWMLMKYSNNKHNFLLLHWPILKSHLGEKNLLIRERLFRKYSLEILWCLEFVPKWWDGGQWGSG